MLGQVGLDDVLLLVTSAATPQQSLDLGRLDRLETHY